MTAPRNIGQAAEDFALKTLKDKGFVLLERNFLCKQGELDLVMMDQKDLVFVEVRYRNSDRFGGAEESIDHFKQRKLKIAAEIWLQKNHQVRFDGCRFDVVSVTGDAKNFHGEWISDAF